jgi:L-asparaginase II
VTEPLVVRAVRSGTVESVHLVDVAVVDRAGTLLASAGEPERLAAFRSSAKPIQARAALEAGWRPSDAQAIAIACASHSGERAHVEAVRSVLAAAGVPEDALRCPLDVPVNADAALAVSERARIYHNCSGKHAGMLAACAVAGWRLDDYRASSHPLQERVAAVLRAVGGVDDCPLLVDGCGVPTPVMSLRAFARAFLAIDDGGPETAAMRAEPFLVGGTGRFDTDLMRTAPNLVSKGGAEGLICLSDGSTGIALKVRDGAARAAPPAAVLVLRALGLLDPSALPAHAAPAVVGGGERVGELRARGGLESARPDGTGA